MTRTHAEWGEYKPGSLIAAYLAREILADWTEERHDHLLTISELKCDVEGATMQIDELCKEQKQLQSRIKELEKSTHLLDES